MSGPGLQPGSLALRPGPGAGYSDRPFPVTGPLLFNPRFTVVDESPDWIIVDKPAHLLCHPTNPDNPPTLLDGLQGLLAFDLANGAALSIITRLDRDTSGLVLVAKNHATARHFGKEMEQGRIGKTYLALVRGWPGEDAWTVDAPILRKGETEPSPIWLKQAVHPEGRPCRTGFEVLERRRTSRPAGIEFALVRCFPFTGRMHQIRVHLAHSGHPVIGDKIYGPDETCYLDFIETGWTEDLARRLLLDRHALHAHRLEVDGQNWMSPLPQDLAQFLADGIPP
jgi:23S rRNA pseudouridine1911/1915/1917 synthase